MIMHLSITRTAIQSRLHVSPKAAVWLEVVAARMGKRTNWNDEAIEWQTGTGEFDREATIENREFLRESNGEKPAQYEAPGEEKKWRARDLLDIHWPLTGIECPASYNRIMSCIIGHANPKDGVCYPRQSTVAIETGYSLETVKRAIRWWKKQGFLETESRGLAHALAYHPQWNLLETFWLAAASDIDEQKASRVTKGTYGKITKGTYGEGHHADLQNLKVETSKDESHPERARSDERAFVEGLRGKEEGIQDRGEVESASTNSQPLEGPSYDEASQRVVGYCKAFHWDHLTHDEFKSAIAAEMVEVGSGRAVVDAAAQKTWALKRKGNRQ
jgi:hypothetical protein